MLLVRQPDEGFHAAVEVAVHEIGRPNGDHRTTTVGEPEDTRVFEEPSQHRDDANVLAQTGHPRTDGADAAYPQVHRHPGARGPVEGVNDALVDDRVDLDLHTGRQTSLLVLDFVLDGVDDAAADALGGHQQSAVTLLGGHPGQVVEEPRDVLGNDRIGRQQSQVLVLTSGLGVVVASADVGVTTQSLALVTDGHSQLAMGLEADHAVDDVDSGTFQYPRPGDVGLLVESGLDLHDGQHLLAGLSGVNEGVDDGGVARGAVQGLLDGQDLRIVGGLLDEPLHAGGEGVVRVVHQDVTTTNGRKHVCRASCLDLGQVRMGDGQEVRVGQVVTVDVGQGEQAGEIKWGRKPEDLLVLDVELTGRPAPRGVPGDVPPCGAAAPSRGRRAGFRRRPPRPRGPRCV